MILLLNNISIIRFNQKSVKVSCTSLFDLNYLLLPSCFLYSVANEQNIIYAVLLIMSLVCIYSTDRKKGCQYPELRKVIYVITGILSHTHRFFHSKSLSLFAIIICGTATVYIVRFLSVFILSFISYHKFASLLNY